MEQKDLKTRIYADGQNTFYWLKKPLNIGKLSEALCANIRGLAYDEAKYFVGLLPEESEKKAREIEVLRHYTRQGVRIFCNDMEPDAFGHMHEVGVDSRIAAEIVHDFLKEGVRGFVLFGNDRDHQPVIQILESLRTMTGQTARVLNPTFGKKPLRGAESYSLIPQFLERFSLDTSSLDLAVHEKYATHPEEALSVEQFDTPNLDIPEPPVPRGGLSGYLIDMDSLEKTAKRVLGRPYLDMSLISFLRETEIAHDRQASRAEAFFYQHTKDYNLEAGLYSQILESDLQRQRLIPKPIPYIYDKNIVGTLPSTGHDMPVKATTFRGKGLHGTILLSALQMASKKTVDTIIVMSDDPNLWPIVNIINDVASASKHAVNVVHAHLDPSTKTYPGASDFLITPELYAKHPIEKDRYLAVENAVHAILSADQENLIDNLELNHLQVSTIPETCVGELVGQSPHWTAFKIYDDEENRLLLLRNTNIPKNSLVFGQTYALTERNGLVSFAAHQDEHARQNEQSPPSLELSH